MMNRLEVDIHHEGLGQDGGIGWIFAVKYVLAYYACMYVCMCSMYVCMYVCMYVQYVCMYVQDLSVSVYVC